jgi:ABC-2 type transport system permease protein
LEKRQPIARTLLATLITTGSYRRDLSVIPAVIATWAGFGIFAIGTLVITGGGSLTAALLDPMWMIAVFIAGPLMAVLSVNFSIMVSSRVNDPRVAEQLSAVVILPLLAVFFGQISGLFILNSTLILILCLILIFIDVLMVYLAVRLFQKKTILTHGNKTSGVTFIHKLICAYEKNIIYHSDVINFALSAHSFAFAQCK